ncbi:MAG: ATP-binding cassette domain-containing protein [Ruminococcus sp.]|nr:ATP-binding cassette domain-containing protein [Ruminococcus sp.]
MEIVRLEKLSFTYPGSDAPALDGIDLSVSRGELVLICGASGSGKSTLLRQLKPTLAPKGISKGNVLLFSKSSSELTEREAAELIGFVGQDPESMIVTDKVWHELAFSLESLSADNGTIRRRTAEMSEFFGMTDSLEKPTAELSGGQKQLLSLASAMTTRPELMLLDEPSARLDPIAAKEFFDAVKRINRELGTTVIVTEHRLEEVLPKADRLICLDKGRIVLDTTPSELRSELLTGELYHMLPVPVRVWLACKGEGSCPVSVSEGREWLSHRAEESTLSRIEHKPSPLSGEKAVKLKNITFRYSKNAKNVLDGLSFEVNKGSSLCILGGNGSGKSTLLSVICGLKMPLSGSVELFWKKSVMMPQEPASLFVCDRLYDDMLDIIEDEDRIAEVLNLCELNDLTEKHPYDLSGGELQRAAFAKLLLTEPDILLLDEPTKGIDAVFKYRLGCLIRELCSRGVTVITVTHDVEFAAEFADRCAMLFGGSLIGFDDSYRFFTENMFYTTAAARMSKGIADGAVTADDLIKALGSKPVKPEIRHNDDQRPALPPKKENDAKHSRLRIGVKLLSVLMLLLSAAGCMEIIPKMFDKNKMIPYYLLAASAVMIAFSFSDGRTVDGKPRKRSKPTVFSAAASAVMLLLIPFTVWFGATCMNTGKYLFVSLVVMLEASLPFYLMFEGRKPKARELTAIAVMIAAAVAGRAAFYMLPQFKPVLAVVVIAGASFGGEAGFIVGSFSMLISNFMFGQGPWTPWQMFSMGLVGLISGVIFGRGILPRRREIIALFGFFAAVVIYGGIVNPSTLFIMHNEINRESLTAAYAAGLPLDLIHGAASLGFLFMLAPAVLKKMERLRVKYGFFE